MNEGNKLSDPPAPEEIGVFQAKTELSHLLRQTRAGKTFIITQRGKPVAELRPVRPTTSASSGWGDMQGEIQINDDFCDPIAEMQDYMN